MKRKEQLVPKLPAVELLRLRRDLEQRVRVVQQELVEQPEETVEQDPGDCSAHVMRLALESDARMLRSIDEALTRLASEGYGVCTRCGAAISEARLRALPCAERCLPCQVAVEGAHSTDIPRGRSAPPPWDMVEA